ncbi:hypothetical protein A2818_00890 [Candidatus Nomurabacteria bacterium RIFCSPHIGHO2_01_FULL_40_12]|uniref:HTTM domain-containing protein n=1 Tax=Candidatus Nomurabacteria bacterium RIFCSPHIGHO2_01_FULL_40_12 TaxID=1801737 RepID=A0A1F6UZC0_9BACT|nr:MAG: hypothetical protein A2818_00890 [Candidatus Nomurabacteria bacterium RIFCSPHIGHO2_01_FULL_40_12]
MNLLNFTKKYFHYDSLMARIEGYAQKPELFFSAQLLVRVYYFFLLYASMALIASWDFSLGPQTGIAFIAPIGWLNYVSFPLGMIFIRLFFIFTSLLASIAPQFRLVRILSFIALLEFVSLYFSVLQLDVDWYTMLLTSFMLIFLPNKWDKIDLFPIIARQKFLLVFWGCQAIVALTYSMAGLGKLVGGVNQFLAGESFILEPKAAALQVADRLLTTNSTSLLGPWTMEHYMILWPFFIGTIYLLLFSFIAVFRPSTHRIWGFGLILFHIGNYLFINIGFSAHIFLLSLLFLASPLAPRVVSWREILYDLPIVGFILRIFKIKYV